MTYEQEKIKPYGTEGSKDEQVERMFDTIASGYDGANHRLSWNMDKRWRRKMAEHLAASKPRCMLDVATGTGDSAIQVALLLRPESITAADISEEMMAIGRKKAAKAGLSSIINFTREDCMNLSFASETFDAVTAAFGIRNFSDLERGLGEMYRVLKKGGNVCILELTTPTMQPMKSLYNIYSHTVFPIYGKIASGDKAAYAYLTATIEAFPQGEQMMGIFAKVGFRNAGFKRLTAGICTMYYAVK